MSTEEKRSTNKLDTIRRIENDMQKQWADRKYFQSDAPKKWNDKLVSLEN